MLIWFLIGIINLALDLEFTGLYLNGKDKPSLFDSLEKRYKICRLACQSFIPCQIGLSFFTKDATQNHAESCKMHAG